MAEAQCSIFPVVADGFDEGVLGEYSMVELQGTLHGASSTLDGLTKFIKGEVFQNRANGTVAYVDSLTHRLWLPPAPHRLRVPRWGRWQWCPG